MWTTPENYPDIGVDNDDARENEISFEEALQSLKDQVRRVILPDPEDITSGEILKMQILHVRRELKELRCFIDEILDHNKYRKRPISSEHLEKIRDMLKRILTCTQV